MLVSFDTKFVRQDQKQRRNGKPIDVFLVESDKLDIKRPLSGFYSSCVIKKKKTTPFINSKTGFFVALSFIT